MHHTRVSTKVARANTDVCVARDSALSEILGFVNVWPENWCKSVKVWCLGDSCKTVKVSEPPETLVGIPRILPPPYGYAALCLGLAVVLLFLVTSRRVFIP